MLVEFGQMLLRGLKAGSASLVTSPLLLQETVGRFVLLLHKEIQLALLGNATVFDTLNA